MTELEPFTNKDLKHLEDNAWPKVLSYEELSIQHMRQPYLLARLEAAERYAESGSYKDRMAWKASKGELTGKIRLMAKRKAAGK